MEPKITKSLITQIKLEVIFHKPMEPIDENAVQTLTTILYTTWENETFREKSLYGSFADAKKAAREKVSAAINKHEVAITKLQKYLD